MIRVLSVQEARAKDIDRFMAIVPSLLFSFSIVSGLVVTVHFCIAVQKVGHDVWEVIELTEENKAKIVRGLPCDKAKFGLDVMTAINLH
ncbi:MAG: hypothetical protein KBC81_00945 [Candidatus Pacebacteria bacterium]|nr:hypothetical protein [Candidatus Paceibacterota bacterium]